ncbi:deferrochelatase/peroxidase EfeB, partial [Streptomyces sp. SID3212]|nr:deferrochelatase/peroxidase EfeB [Streptomyces sp. SID3212]
MTTDRTEDSTATGPTPPHGDANPAARDAPSGVRRRSFLHRALAAGAAGAAVGAGG